MSLFPLNTNWARQAQTDVSGVRTSLLSPVMYTPGAPAVAASATVLSTNTVKLDSALGGTAVKIYYIL